jgi:hypothetical protein
MLAEQTFQQLNLPRIVQEQRASALRFADPMVQAIWNALLVFDRLPTGFCNRDLRNNLAALLGRPVEHFTQGRMSYQLRRLRLHGLIEDSQNSSLPPHNLGLPCRHVLHAHLRKDFASRSWPGAAEKLFLPIGPAAQLR